MLYKYKEAFSLRDEMVMSKHGGRDRCDRLISILH